MKKKALGLVALSLVFGMSFATSLTSCTQTSSSVGTGGGETQKVLESIAVTKAPTKIVYLEGEEFDKSGMEITATYSDDSTEKVNNYRVKVDPDGPLSVDDTSVTLTYEDKSTTCNITVNAIVCTKLEITNDPISTAFARGGVYDFTGLEVTATLENQKEPKVLSADEYTLSVDGKTIKDGDTVELEGKEDPYTVTVSYKQQTTTFNITVINGYKIEGENILFTEPTAEDTNYVRLKVSEDGEYLTEPSESGTIRAVSGVDDAEYASGKAYLGDLKNGNVIEFYFTSEVATTADISIQAASGYLIKDDGNWVPEEMGDMQFNKTVEVTLNGTKANISDDVILEGGTVEDVGGVNAMLWANWKTVNFGTMNVVEGLNVVKFVVASEYINCHGTSCAFNLDYLSVDFGA